MKSFGLITSLIVHALIFSIPVSIFVRTPLKEVELLVIQDEPIHQPIEKRFSVKPIKGKRFPSIDTDVSIASRPSKIIHPPQPQRLKDKEALHESQSYRDEALIDNWRDNPTLDQISVEKERIEVASSMNNERVPEHESKVLGDEKTAKSIHISESPAGIQHAPIVTRDVKPERRVESRGFEGSHSISAESSLDTAFGQGDGPSFLHRQIPEYPYIARRMGKEGRVVLRLTIDERGELQNVEVVEEAGYGFTEAAIRAVKKSRFLPAKRNGSPVSSRAILPIHFVLRRE